MATATLEFACIDGLTLTAELYTPGTDTLIQGSITCTERQYNKSVYTGSIVDVATGTYRLRVRNASNNTILTDFLDHTNEAATEYPRSEVGSSAITSGSTADEVWSYDSRTLTQTAAEIADVLQGSDITIQRGDTTTIAITGLGSIVGRTKLWFTAKKKKSQADSASNIQIEETLGLSYVEGEAYGTSSDGSITVNNASLGNITITIKAAATALLTEGMRYYDVQVKHSAGTIETLTMGSLKLVPDVTLATS